MGVQSIGTNKMYCVKQRAKIAETDMTAVNINYHFRDGNGEMERGQVEIIPNPWNLRPQDKTKSEITRIPQF